MNQTSDAVWRDAIPANYLSQDHFLPGEEKTLTIKSAGQEVVEDPARQSKKRTLVVHWMEDVLPMVFNVTNSRTVEKLLGTKVLSDWPGHKVTVYFDETIKFGRKAVGGLRIRPYPTKEESAKDGICFDCGAEIQGNCKAPTATVIAGTKKTYGVPLCLNCASARAKERSGQ